MGKNSFVSAMKMPLSQKPDAVTQNAALTFASSGDVLVDLFSLAGTAAGTRNSNRVSYNDLFERSFQEDPILATKIMLWARDIRGGAGRRQVFRDWLQWMEKSPSRHEILAKVIPLVAEYGRFDDLLVFETQLFKERAFDQIAIALRDGNGLAAKWMPRQGKTAVELARHIIYNGDNMPVPSLLKQWRKLVVGLSQTVETQMSAKRWGEINYNHVPSLATIRYRKAFNRHDPVRYAEWVESLSKGDDSAKVNAGAVYPFDVLKALGLGSYRSYETADHNLIEAQWKALPDYVGEASFIPLVDVSGSMTCKVQGSTSALDVSVSLGLYLSERNKGDFKDVVVNFSSESELLFLNGKTVVERARELAQAPWGGSTNLQAAFDQILSHAKKNRVPQEDMPENLLIISDMEFNYCGENTNLQTMRLKYEEAGYRMPNVIFWNVNGRQGNSPARADEKGIALVSGFSPSIMKNLFKSASFTPRDVMLNVINDPRYDFMNSRVVA